MIFNMVGGGSDGFVNGTAVHSRTEGLTVSGLLAPPKMCIIFQFGNYAQSSYTAYALATNWDGNAYNTTFGFDADGYGYEESASPKLLTVTATYNNGIFNIKTGCSRWNGQQWYFDLVY